MGVFNSPMQSMTYTEDGIAQAGAAAAKASYYTVTNYSSGGGRLMLVGYYNASANTADAVVRITIDGGSAITWDADSIADECANMFQGIGGGYLSLPLNLEFTTSLLVEIANDNVGVQNIRGQTHYGVLSKEVERRVIPAGSPLPGREYTEAVDVMCIMIQSGGGLASRLIYPTSQRVDLSQGKVLEYDFNTDLNGPVRSWIQSNFTGSMKTVLNGELITIDVVNGVIQVVPEFIRAIDFWDRFTEAEQEDLHDSNHKKAKNFMCRFKMKKHINLAEAKMITAVRNLESGKFIAPGRADEILG